MRMLEDFQKSLDQEQQLHAMSVRRVRELEGKVQLLEHQPSEVVGDMIALLEQTRNSFLKNHRTINGELSFLIDI